MDKEYLDRFKKDPTSVLNGAMVPPPSPHKTYNGGRGVGGGKGNRHRFASPEQLQFVIDEYYTRCEAMEQPPTLADLVLACGFSCKSSFYAQRERNDEFQHVVDTAILKMEGWKNRLLLRGGPTTQAAIFDLKNNHKWADKTETTTTHVPGGSLAELVQALQGKVLRPSLMRPEEEIVDGEFTEESDDEEFEPVADEPEEVIVEEVPEPPKKEKKYPLGYEWKRGVEEMLRREYEEKKRLNETDIEDLL